MGRAGLLLSVCLLCCRRTPRTGSALSFAGCICLCPWLLSHPSGRFLRVLLRLSLSLCLCLSLSLCLYPLLQAQEPPTCSIEVGVVWLMPTLPVKFQYLLLQLP